MAKKPVSLEERELEKDSIELTVKVDFDELIEEMTSYMSSADIVTFITKLEDATQDFDVTRDLYEHFHKKVMEAV